MPGLLSSPHGGDFTGIIYNRAPAHHDSPSSASAASLANQSEPLTQIILTAHNFEPFASSATSPEPEFTVHLRSIISTSASAPVVSPLKTSSNKRAGPSSPEPYPKKQAITSPMPDNIYFSSEKVDNMDCVNTNNTSILRDFRNGGHVETRVGQDGVPDKDSYKSVTRPKLPAFGKAPRWSKEAGGLDPKSDDVEESHCPSTSCATDNDNNYKSSSSKKKIKAKILRTFEDLGQDKGAAVMLFADICDIFDE